ncbi:ABC transporter substrate-binding protein [Paenibacillus pasadenensis]|uniref:ABC transporter substrate-binding protein n=1 Tax=Paenibacillus pasadenensis TaxID=217090 RepID=UPI00203E092E|nr:ABC transporter substrate-binding protein [Paenibacillus pasadenensis]MCM3747039.1 ABC transporter substrate-binding protein [Paenibacillus pasadenensis]
MNRPKLKHSRIFLLLWMMLLVLSACSSAGNSTANQNPPSNPLSQSGLQDKEQTNDGNAKLEGVVTISVVTTNYFLNEAKKKFEAENPGIRIEIKEAQSLEMEGGGRVSMEGYSPIAVEKYTTQVNAELMNGNASDLIAVDILAYNKYADKKLLVDFNEYMNEANGFKPENYYMNIFDAMKHNGGLYALPLSVTTDLWFADKARIKDANLNPDSWTWEQFDQIVEEGESGGGPVIAVERPDLFFLDRVKGELDRYLNAGERKAAFDSPEFIQLLEQIKAYPKGQYSSGKIKETFYPYLKLTVPQMITFGHVILDHPQIMAPPAPDAGDGRAFKSDLLLALNNKSKVKKEAWAFLQFLLSEKIQGLQGPDGLSGLSVNKQVMEARLAELQEGKKETGYKKPTAEEAQLLSDLMPQLKRFGGMDSKIEAILTDEANSFFKGEQSAEDAAKAIQNKITLYLEE